MKTISIVVFAVFFCLGASAFGKTPDGMTPSEEQDCTYLDQGFGLCNAFCEAQDCDDQDPLDWKKSCFRLLENYQDQVGKPGPPCFCGEVCDIRLDECLAGCPPGNNCCPVNCRNAFYRCDTNCCNQAREIELNKCLEESEGDPDAPPCLQTFCATQLEICVIPGSR